MNFSNPQFLERFNNDGLRGIDLPSALMENRILVLNGPVDQDSCMSLIAACKILEHKDPVSEITILISSEGGDYYSGMGLISVIQELSCPVHTIAVGLVASMAAVILACGNIREAYSGSWIMLHQIMTGLEARTQESDVAIAARHTADIRNQLDNLLSRVTKKSKEAIREMTERDCWLSAKQAMDAGVIDLVISAPTRSYSERVLLVG